MLLILSLNSCNRHPASFFILTITHDMKLFRKSEDLFVLMIYFDNSSKIGLDKIGY